MLLEPSVGPVPTYYGLAAVPSAGTDVGPLSFDVRKEQPQNAARLLTAGRGMAAPDGGPGIPSIALSLDDLGTVATGKSADFLVLDANPLENISNTSRISAVYTVPTGDVLVRHTRYRGKSVQDEGRADRTA